MRKSRGIVGLDSELCAAHTARSRRLLVSCYEQSARIACSKAERFGLLPQQLTRARRVPSDTETVVKAAAWLRRFLGGYADGEHELIDAMMMAVKAVAKLLPFKKTRGPSGCEA